MHRAVPRGKSCSELIGGALRILNALGGLARRLGVEPVALEERRLLAAAGVDAQGLLAQFDGAPEGFERLLEACREEAALNTVGRLALRRHAIELLVNLERVRAARAAEPAIAAQPISAPLVVTGLPRTGSTLLFGLLAQDPANRAPRTWEIMQPPIAPEEAPRLRRACARQLRWAQRVAPRFRRIHPLGADLPEECIAITAQVFQSIEFHTIHHVPGYQDWLDARGYAGAYRYHRMFLQHLQHVGGGGRWVLKAPGHMFGIRELLAEYPDAIVVHMHRDPQRVAPSLASHTTVLREAFSDAVEPGAVARDWLDRWWRGLDVLIAARDETPGRFVDVYYDDLVRDPIAAVAALYGAIGRELGADAGQRMRAFLAANPKDKHGRHRYAVEDFAIEPREIDERLAAYLERFPAAAG